MKILILISQLFVVYFAQAKELKIEVGEAGSKQSTVAIMDVIGVSKISKNSMILQIKNNLNFSTYFKFVDLPKELSPKGTISAAEADKINKMGVEFLVVPSTASQGNVEAVQFKVYRLKNLKLALDQTYKASAQAWTQIANNFSDDFMKALTGKKSIFSTKIAVTSDRAGKGWKEIYVMDWNGANASRVSYHKASTLSPKWSPGGSQIVYSAITVQAKTGSRNANLYIYDFRTRRRSQLSARPGINSGGSFFPDGRSLVMTLTQGGVPDLFRIALNGNVLERFTRGPGRSMNVEPSVSPDGRTLAFSSDRKGKPMIFTMDVTTKQPKRLTFAGRYNSAPSWSPDGKKIVFSGWVDGHFDVFTMNVNGTNLKRITQARKANGKWSNNESPSFSPDGRFIAFISNRNGKKQLYTIREDGSNLTRVTKDSHNYYHAQWSPYLN